jgi:Co/Zn/Cd efflux system component
MASRSAWRPSPRRSRSHSTSAPSSAARIGAIEADHVHYQSDLLLNGAVIAALALEQYAGVLGADPLFGIAIALWLLWAGGAPRAARSTS